MTKLLLAVITPRVMSLSTLMRSSATLLACTFRAVSSSAPVRSPGIPKVSAATWDANHGVALRPVDIAQIGGALEKVPLDLSDLESSGDEDKTTLTLMGFKGGRVQDQINQDSAIIVSPLVLEGDEQPEHDHKKEDFNQIIGVFDGHGWLGERTSQYAAVTIPQLMAKRLSASQNSTQIADLIKGIFEEVDQSDPSGGNGGCTASVVLQMGNKIYIANTGDSVSAIATMIREDPDRNIRQDIQIVYTSREDKPDIPEERERILAMGGFVEIPKDPATDVPRAYSVGKNGELNVGLAMSRSIGDGPVQGVIAEPIVDVLDIESIATMAMKSYADQCAKDEGDDQTCAAIEPDDVHIFAFSTTDGLSDYIKPIDVAQVMGPSFFGYGRHPDTVHPHKAAQQLIIRAAMMWYDEELGQYRDDIAIAASKIVKED